MFPHLYSLPNVFSITTNRSMIDLKNQYSIVNRLQSKDVLSNFSMELESKLPRINKRLKKISEKQNQITERQNKMAADRQLISFLQKDLEDMKKLVLSSQNNCCCKSHGFPMMQYPMYQMPFNGCQNGNQRQRNSLNHRQPRESHQSSTQNIGKNKGKNSKKRKTFRKYAYAVYFCIFLKYYSAKFTKNRYQFFKERYLSNNGEKVKEDSYKITKTLEAIDLMNIVAQSSDTISDKLSSLNLTDAQEFNFKQVGQLIPSKMVQQFEKALNFVNLYVKQVEEIVMSPKFIDFYGQIIGIGTINQSFYMDDLMIPQEIQFITFSEKKGFAQISPDTQKTLITIYVFIKHIIFKILLKLKERKYLENRLKDTYAKFEDQKQETYEFLELATALMYSLINTIFVEYLQNAPKTNYDKLKKRFKISPAKVLTAPNCPKNLKENINYQQIIAGVPKISQIAIFLENEKYDDYLGYLVQKIDSLSIKLLEGIKQVNKAIYDHIKPETLNQNYLIFEGINNEKNKKSEKMPSNETKPFLSPRSRLSNTSLGANSKLFKKTRS